MPKKFELETLPEGVVVCNLLAPLSQAEARQIVVGIERFLANGKARIILNFTPEAATAEGGVTMLDKSLRSMKILAKKMRGDIVFVIPEPHTDMMMGAQKSLKAAIQTILGQQEAPVDRGELAKELASKKAELNRLKAENVFLEGKVQELLEIVRQPSTDAELKNAVHHYQLLAAQAEEENPNSGTKKK